MNITKKLDLLKDLIEDNDYWTIEAENDLILIESKLYPDSNIACFKCTGHVNCSPEKVMEHLWKENSLEEMQKNDSDLIFYQTIENIDDSTRLCHQINRLPWPLWSRDFVYIKHKIQVENTYFLLVFSVTSNKVPENPDNYVRGHINISGYAIYPVNNGSKICRIAHIDPSGIVPASVVNSQASKIATPILIMQKNNFSL